MYAPGERARWLALGGGGPDVAVVLGDGYRYAQVFAPADADFVCLEPMTAPVNALVAGGYALVPPAESLTARFTLHAGDHRRHGIVRSG